MSHQKIKRKSGGSSIRKDWHLFWPVLAVLAVPLLLMAFAIAKTSWIEHSQKLATGQDLLLNIAKLRPNQLHLFETSASGQKVRFVVERTQDNTIHVALAACKICNRERRSNRVQDGAIVCARCNGPMAFKTTKPEGSASDCDLTEIPHHETAQILTVLARDITQTATRLSPQ